MRVCRQVRYKNRRLYSDPQSRFIVGLREKRRVYRLTPFYVTKQPPAPPSRPPSLRSHAPCHRGGPEDIQSYIQQSKERLRASGLLAGTLQLKMTLPGPCAALRAHGISTVRLGYRWVPVDPSKATRFARFAQIQTLASSLMPQSANLK